MGTPRGIGARILVSSIGLGAPCLLPAADCNLNGLGDAAEIRTGASADCDANGVPDYCQLLPAAIGFQRAVERELARFPGDVLAGDFDGDADVDLAAVLPPFTGIRPGSVLVLPSDGDGTFSPAVGSEIGIDLVSQTTPTAAADLDGDGNLDLAITTYSTFFRVLRNRGRGAFTGGAGPACAESADADNNGAVNVADAIQVLGYLFRGGSRPTAPGPPDQPCGGDPDPPGSAGALGCERYDPCG
jgi:hypothetical protein